MEVLKDASGQTAKDKCIKNLGQQVREPFYSHARMSTIQSHHRNNEWRSKRMNEGEHVYQREIMELEEFFSKLNPMAEDFVPPSRTVSDLPMNRNGGCATAADAMDSNGLGNSNGSRGPRAVAKKKTNSRTSTAQREEKIRRTVYVSDIDQQVTEEQLATLFSQCGQVVDCRVCGDPRSVLRFAFVEFTDQESARIALGLFGTIIGYYPVKVSPSKTAIAPVNPTYLPQTLVEQEMCSRTVYVTNIDKKVSQTKVKLYFEKLCGEVYRLRLLGDYHHCTRIAFVEFVEAESAIAALNCTGVMLGSLPIRVSPSKTPVRMRARRPMTP